MYYNIYIHRRDFYRKGAITIIIRLNITIHTIAITRLWCSSPALFKFGYLRYIQFKSNHKHQKISIFSGCAMHILYVNSRLFSVLRGFVDPLETAWSNLDPFATSRTFVELEWHQWKARIRFISPLTWATVGPVSVKEVWAYQTCCHLIQLVLQSICPQEEAWEEVKGLPVSQNMGIWEI